MESVMVTPLSFMILVIYIFFFLVSVARGLSIYWSFQRSSFCFHWFFSIFFLFSIPLIFNFYYFFSSISFTFTLLFFLYFSKVEAYLFSPSWENDIRHYVIQFKLYNVTCYCKWLPHHNPSSHSYLCVCVVRTIKIYS